MKPKGFTLIELLVVVAIIGILAAVGVVAYSGYTTGAKVSSSKSNHKTVIKFITNSLMKCEMGEKLIIKYLKIIIIMLISITCMGFIFQILQTSIPKVIDIRLSESLNLDTAKIGMAVSSIYIVSGLMNYIGGILADKYSEKMIYVSGILGQAILLFVVASTSNHLLIIFALMTVAFNSSILPAENVLLAKFSPEKYQGLVYGIKFIVSFAIAPIAVLLISKSYEMTSEFIYLYMGSGFIMILVFMMAISLPYTREPKTIS